MATLDIRVSGDVELDALLEGLKEAAPKAANFRGAASNAEKTGLLDRIRARFVRKVDPWEIPWVPSHAGLSRVHPEGTLWDTGRLYRAIQVQYVGDYSWYINLTPGSDASEYGYFHNSGLSGDKRFYKREFLNYSERDVDLIVYYLKRRLMEYISKMRT